MISLLFFALTAFAEVPEYANVSRVAKQCFQNEVDLFEQIKGRLPTDDEADLIIDMCIKRAYERETEL